MHPALITERERETARLAALDHLDAVRPEADQVLQELVDEVRSIFGTELGMVNLILSDTQYFRAWSGGLPANLVEVREDLRENSMCPHVVATEMPLVVHDFLATDEFKDQHYCVEYGFRFYAGTPLITSDGQAIGTLCLLDTQPRELSEEQMKVLAAFARAVASSPASSAVWRTMAVCSAPGPERPSSMAVVRPAEFIVLRFSHKMQEA